MRRIFVGVSQSTVMLNAMPVAQAAGDEHEVLVLAAGLVDGLRRDEVDRRLAEPADEVEVVRREILDDADVLDAVGERPAALGADEEDLPHLALLGAPAQLDERRVEALDVPDRGADAGVLARRDDLLRLGDRARERLLDQQVHARRGERPRDREVLVRRHGDDREVGLAAVEQLVDRRVHVGRGRAPRRSGRRPGRPRPRTRSARSTAAAARDGGPSSRGRRSRPAGRALSWALVIAPTLDARRAESRRRSCDAIVTDGSGSVTRPRSGSASCRRGVASPPWRFASTQPFPSMRSPSPMSTPCSRPASSRRTPASSCSTGCSSR